MSKDEEIGTLIVVVLKAQNLKDVHFYKQDVYTRITFNGVTKRTKVDVKGGQHPIWDEELRFPVMKNSAPKYRNLEASCWTKEHKEEDDVLLGEGKIDMAETLKTGEFDEWVPLSTNGNMRGDVYLEMTFYSNGPAPVNLMPPAGNNNLTRRPSKLKPADRLYRPPQPVTPPKKVEAPLPPVPESVPAAPLPGALKPGPKRPSPGHSPYHQPQNLPPAPYAGGSEQSTAPVPAILRPGPSARPPQDPRTSYHHSRNSSAGASYSYPQDNSANAGPQDAYVSTSAYISSSVPSSPPLAGSGYRPPVAHPAHSSTPGWNQGHPSHGGRTASFSNSNPADQEGSSFSFPVPDLPAAPSIPSAPYDYAPNPSPSPYQPPYQPPTPAPAHHHYRTSSYPSQPTNVPNSTSNLPDPYLLARYQSPLPLPPGVNPQSTPPQAQPHSHFTPPRQQQHHHNNENKLPIPRSTSTSPSRSHTPVDETRLRQLRQAEEEAARRKAQEERDRELARQLDEELSREPAPAPPPARDASPPKPPPKTPSPAPISAAEEARRRRQEQEEKDMELARQLDRELNLASGGTESNRRPSGPHMPGEW
ncbi:hypothetical protein K435DRAFT_776828 [Dendrothele bispora CBS 962.96]|uniref:C2 domain-containing protein n=1 Tax=Dendrothele bispora (strain CBS 962.96) TaxID=1314807 RepID=A0A4S8MCC2_DENBC|nr:hypothetical protein K435DRAFT_776828 [Dendrothele bispora CBS 962.96]